MSLRDKHFSIALLYRSVAFAAITSRDVFHSPHSATIGLAARRAARMAILGAVIISAACIWRAERVIRAVFDNLGYRFAAAAQATHERAGSTRPTLGFAVELLQDKLI
jgi:hypothetical protein